MKATLNQTALISNRLNLSQSIANFILGSFLIHKTFIPRQNKTDTYANSVTRRLIRIYIVCHSVFDLRLKPLFTAVDMSEFKDGSVHFRNSGLKGLSPLTSACDFKFYSSWKPVPVRRSNYIRNFGYILLSRCQIVHEFQLVDRSVSLNKSLVIRQ